jgi:hypothetical protein
MRCIQIGIANASDHYDSSQPDVSRRELCRLLRPFVNSVVEEAQSTAVDVSQGSSDSRNQDLQLDEDEGDKDKSDDLVGRVKFTGLASSVTFPVDRHRGDSLFGSTCY